MIIKEWIKKYDLWIRVAVITLVILGAAVYIKSNIPNANLIKESEFRDKLIAAYKQKDLHVKEMLNNNNEIISNLNIIISNQNVVIEMLKSSLDKCMEAL